MSYSIHFVDAGKEQIKDSVSGMSGSVMFPGMDIFEAIQFFLNITIHFQIMTCQCHANITLKTRFISRLNHFSVCLT